MQECRKYRFLIRLVLFCCAGPNGNVRRQWAWNCWPRRATTRRSSGCTADRHTDVGLTRLALRGPRVASPAGAAYRARAAHRLPQTCTTGRRPWPPPQCPRSRSHWPTGCILVWRVALGPRAPALARPATITIITTYRRRRCRSPTRCTTAASTIRPPCSRCPAAARHPNHQAGRPVARPDRLWTAGPVQWTSKTTDPTRPTWTFKRRPRRAGPPRAII